MPTFHERAIDCTHRGTKQVMHEGCGKSKLFLRKTAAEEVTGDRLGRHLVRILFYFGMMLFGMAGQYFWRLKSMKTFELGEFVRPLWISFIVFTPFWTASKVDGISYVAAAAAYQNGFFWKVVLDKEVKQMKSAKPRGLREKPRKRI
ncbi:MAG TPA: hypothetical protein VFP43_21135 [Mesorhizobium sp.]|nr:hypothetical protein [Mesorhizobium sp.]